MSNYVVVAVHPKTRNVVVVGTKTGLPFTSPIAAHRTRRRMEKRFPGWRWEIKSIEGWDEDNGIGTGHVPRPSEGNG